MVFSSVVSLAATGDAYICRHTLARAITVATYRAASIEGGGNQYSDSDEEGGLTRLTKAGYRRTPLTATIAGMLLRLFVVTAMVLIMAFHVVLRACMPVS